MRYVMSHPLSRALDPHRGKNICQAVLPANVLGEDESADPDVLPESASITRIDDLLEQMRFHEQPKRALFSVPFELGNGFTIGVKGSVLRYIKIPATLLYSRRTRQVRPCDGTAKRVLQVFR